MVVLNRLYYSDAYGIYKIDIEDLVGESQSKAVKFLSTPTLPSNNVSYMSGNHIDGYSFLVLSMADAYGSKIVKDETDISEYSDGYLVSHGQLNSRGILYQINKTLNRIEVYYGAHFRSGTRSPDFIYDGYSTPSLFSSSVIESLHIVSSGSLNLSEGTRIYVGQTTGMTVIDAVDEEATDGYSAGNDSSGSSLYYGISGSGATYENIGGTVSRVSDIATDDDNGIIFVVTNDGYGNGGLTQIKMTGNRFIIFMNEASGHVPSDDIRDVTKSE